MLPSQNLDADCYYTFTKEYEINELSLLSITEWDLELFSDMVAKNCIYRGLKPVYWSPHSHTALAEAELEYSSLPFSPIQISRPQKPQYLRLFRSSKLSQPCFAVFYVLSFASSCWSSPSFILTIARLYYHALDDSFQRLSLCKPRSGICRCENSPKRAVFGHERARRSAFIAPPRPSVHRSFESLRTFPSRIRLFASSTAHSPHSDRRTPRHVRYRNWNRPHRTGSRPRRLQHLRVSQRDSDPRRRDQSERRRHSARFAACERSSLFIAGRRGRKREV